MLALTFCKKSFLVEDRQRVHQQQRDLAQVVQRETHLALLEGFKRMGRVHLRFARFGRIDKPFYRIVAIDSRKAREGQPLEYVSGLFSCIS